MDERVVKLYEIFDGLLKLGDFNRAHSVVIMIDRLKEQEDGE